MREEASCCVSTGEEEVKEWELLGREISPCLKTSGELRVVSTTVEVGLSMSLPASRNRSTMSCFLRLVYFLQSCKLYGSFLPLVLALVAVMGEPYSIISLRAKSCLGKRTPRVCCSDSSLGSSL